MNPTSPFEPFTPPAPARMIKVSERLLEDIRRAAAILSDYEIAPALQLLPYEWAHMLPQPEVQQAISEGRAMAKLAAGSTILAAASAGDAKAAMDYLTHKGGWRKQTETDMVEVAQAQVVLDLSKLSDAELENLSKLQQKVLDKPKVP